MHRSSCGPARGPLAPFPAMRARAPALVRALALAHGFALVLALAPSRAALAAEPPASGLPPAPAPAATAPAPASAPAGAAASVAPDSPRASLERYLALCRAGAWNDAAAYLDLPSSTASGGATLARRLKAVLDRHVWIDLDTVSPRAEGNTGDGLPAFDEVARIPGPAGAPEPVRLVRRATPDGARWLFAATTVSRIDEWWADLPDRWTHEHLPEALLRPGPGDLLFWQWLLLPVLLAAAFLAGHVLSWATRRALNALVRRTRAKWDDALLARTRGPLRAAWALVGLRLALPWLGLYAPAHDLSTRVIASAFYVVFFWILLRSVDVARDVALEGSWLEDRPAVRALAPLGARVGKALVLAVAVIAVLSELGYPVASLVAGLGIGGLAFALAAQKTVENLFGAFSIGVDQPFREGDFIRVEDLEGTVEAIGLRSTRIRTLDRTLVTIPNGKLADLRVTSLTARDRIRLHCKLGLVYGTSAANVRAVVEGIEAVLRGHEYVWQDQVIVKFCGFADSALDVEISAWFRTGDWFTFLDWRQEVLLRFMEVVEKSGSAFAFPTRTIHMVPAA